MVALSAGEIKLTSTEYHTKQTYKVVGTATVTELLARYDANQQDADCFHELFILKEGDPPVSLSNHFYYLRKRPAGTVVTLLSLSTTKALYVSPASVNQVDAQPLVSPAA